MNSEGVPYNGEGGAWRQHPPKGRNFRHSARVAALPWNHWQHSRGMSGRLGLEYAANSCFALVRRSSCCYRQSSARPKYSRDAQSHMDKRVHRILESASNQELANHLLDTFQNAQKNYFFEQWAACLADTGRFIEAVRRFLEFQFSDSNRYTPVAKTLKPLDARLLTSYENASGDEAYRIHIPRVLYAIYGMRNKRGAGHLSPIDPGHQDATVAISSVKWVLAELIRLNSTYDQNETTLLLGHVIETPVDGLWKIKNRVRVMVDGLNYADQVLYLLFAGGLETEDELQKSMEINLPYLRRQLEDLHYNKYIDYSKEDGKCVLSQKGARVIQPTVLRKLREMEAGQD